MKKIITFILFLICQSIFGQILTKDCPKKVSYFAFSLDDWHIPIKYNIVGDLIDLKIKKKEDDELFIRFKIIETLKCNFKDADNNNLKYRILTYDEETNSYEERQSEIEFEFSHGKEKIYIRHPNFPVIISEATSLDQN